MNRPATLLFTGSSQYDVLQRFTEDLASGLDPVYVVDVNHPKLADQLQHAIAGPLRGAAGFNGIRADVEANGKHLFDFLGIHFTSILLDHPIYHLASLRDPNQNLELTVIDRNHLHFLESRCMGLRQARFLPHGGCAAQIEGQVAAVNGPRDINLFFSGTLHRAEDSRDSWKALDAHLSELGEEMAECLKSDWLTPLETAIDACWGEVTIDHPNFDDYCAVTRHVDCFTRYNRREKLIRAASELDNFICAGSGSLWTDLSRELDLDYRGPLKFSEVLEHMTRARCVLHTQPGFADGSHERPLCAMANGALPLCDRSRWLEETFIPTTEIVFYDPDNLEESLCVGLEHDPDRETLARKARKRHGWATRATRLADHQCS